MNEHTTTDGDEPLDEHVTAALRDVEPMASHVRRAHLDAALAEFDRLDAQPASVAPVVPLRRRSARVLQAAAALVLVVAGVAVVVRVGAGSSQDDQASTAAESVTSAAADEAGGAAGTGAPALSPASTWFGPTDQSQALSEAPTARSSAESDTAAGSPGPLGAYATDGDLRVAVELRASAGTLPAGVDPGIACAAPPEVPGPSTATTATVAGNRREVWVQRNPDGTVATIVLVDPATCRPVS